VVAVAVLGLVATVWLARRAGRATSREAVRRRFRAALHHARSPIWRRPGAGRLELAAALDDVARALRSGASLLQAVDDAGRGPPDPSRRVLADLARVSSRGLPLGQVALAWAATTSSADERLAATALALAADGGRHPARAIDGVAATLRERAAIAAEVRVQGAPARLSALVIAGLPLVFTTWCVVTDPRIAAFLLTTGAGWACLASGAALELVGAWWMARIVRSVA
jgi:Flp pilus assembly protein TadB